MEVEVMAMASEEATSSGAANNRHTSAAKAFRKRSKVGELSLPDASAGAAAGKRPKIESMPEDFLELLPLENENETRSSNDAGTSVWEGKASRQFWKAGDYEGSAEKTSSVGMDHVRVHPKFLHSNATSHKWALGAVAELLDNALDETSHGATYIHIDVLKNPNDDTSPMILFEDNGGGMTQHRMRECMSFGYSEKSKSANTIGQYGNGFKTSTMRLGADVIVFSKSPAKDGMKATASVGLLSYTFLVETGQQDIIVPMLDYEDDGGLKPILRGTEEDWARNVKTITTWSPYRSEETLRLQFRKIKSQGTRILIYNLWDDDQNQLELDFEADPFDIQVRGFRDSNNVSLAQVYASAKHYFLYRHSLRVYASILYLRLPSGFKMMLRGKEIEHHNVVSDLMHIQELTYKPQGGQDVLPGSNLLAVVTLGFIKDAKEHIDVQGFNVYHKNRLIKPFWRIWNSASSQGRGVVGVLEANFVEPAHDKQGFEKTTVLQRLEARLQNMQKDYWNKNCRVAGYQGPPVASRRRYSAREDQTLWRPSSTRSATKSQRTPRRTAIGFSPSSSEESEEEQIQYADDEDEEEEAEERVPRRRRSPPQRDAQKDAQKDSQKDSQKEAQKQKDSQKDAQKQKDSVRDAQKDSQRDAQKDDDEQTPRKSPRSRTRAPARKAAAPTPPARTEKTPEVDNNEVEETPVAKPAGKTPLTGGVSKAVVGKTTPAEQPKQLGKSIVVEEEEPDLDRMQEIAAANDMLTSRLNKLEETDAAKLQLEVSKRMQLEAELESALARGQELEKEITRMEDELQGVQVGLLKERDALKARLDEEREQREIDDIEIRRQLKTALQRIRELEGEVRSLKSGSNINIA